MWKDLVINLDEHLDHFLQLCNSRDINLALFFISTTTKL